MPMPKTIGHQIDFGKSWLGLIKQGFWEIPGVMCSSICALVGIGLGFAGLDRYEKNNGDNREYKSTYMIMRADDPRVKRLKNPVYTKY
ncbi:unnamed protein product [Pieris brassicae]|uniref:Uncharacterized protein n=1 Tax=Pieris brassicae TaxID=7116 RepID=A0A9P0WV57_PIEBR|nr:unnamed protein product [Pieris brassicae]